MIIIITEIILILLINQATVAGANSEERRVAGVGLHATDTLIYLYDGLSFHVIVIITIVVVFIVIFIFQVVSSVSQ